MKNPSRLFSATLYAVLLASSLFAMPAVSATDSGLKSLRGAEIQAPDTESADPFKGMKDSTPIERNYLQQPPIIPHKIDG